MRTPRRLTAAAVLLATALAGTPALLTAADAAPDAGHGAIARAAERYGVSADGLADRLRTDPNFRLTSSGVAMVIDPAPTARTEPVRAVAQSFPLNQTFKLHSKPGSQRTIYLDFNGHNVSNTFWNVDIDGDGPGTAVPNGTHPPMDLAGNGPTFNDTELTQIQNIYERVAEDYAPFDVDVTTEEPPASAIDRTGSGDQRYGTRALISPSNAVDNICGGSCGGVAFITTFDYHKGKDPQFPDDTHAQYQPAWVFPQKLGNDPKNIAEAATHEVGHNLGLDHDSFGGQNNYYAGHGAWAPIMGSGYDRPVSQFAQSTYPGASLGAIQENPDDIAVVVSHGLAIRSDEPGTSTGNASAVPAGTAYISRRTDVDYYALGTCSGAVTVAGQNAPVSPNLDLKVELLDGGGTVLDSDDPPAAFSNRDLATGLDATASATVADGSYFVRVDGSAPGNPLTAYDDYGSLGAYTLQVTGCDGVVEPADAKPGKPRIGTAKPGARGGKRTATVTWRPPSGTTSPAINGWQFVAYKKNSKGRYVQTYTTTFSASAGGARFTTKRRGSYRFAVRARNALGYGPMSAPSNAVTPR
jgi:hypothetical protein